MTTWAAAMVIALVIDAVFGWPKPVYAVIGHPVTWLGRLITTLDRLFNDENAPAQKRRGMGTAAALTVILLAALVAYVIQAWLPLGWPGILVAGIVAWPLVAARSMYDHVVDVLRPLQIGDLAGARAAVAMIVGRDPEQLDDAGVSRAAIESLAENTSDGIVAPLFWGALLGLPGIAAYKAINTLDSMIGHRTPRHEAFGWAAARIDDAANLLPARLTGLLFAAVSGRPRAAFSCMTRDARKHRSPNAGWPEAAMAGALGVRISGPRAYANRLTQEPWINDGAADATADDLEAALNLYVRSMIVLGIVLASTSWLLMSHR